MTPVVRVLVTGLLIGLGLAILVVSQSSLQVRAGDAGAAEREFEKVRQRFGDTPPYIAVELRGE